MYQRGEIVETRMERRKRVIADNVASTMSFHGFDFARVEVWSSLTMRIFVDVNLPHYKDLRYREALTISQLVNETDIDLGKFVGLNAAKFFVNERKKVWPTRH